MLRHENPSDTEAFHKMIQQIQKAAKKKYRICKIEIQILLKYRLAMEKSILNKKAKQPLKVNK